MSEVKPFKLSEDLSLAIFKEYLDEYGPQDFVRELPDDLFVLLNIPQEFFEVISTIPKEDTPENIVVFYKEFKLMALLERTA